GPGRAATHQQRLLSTNDRSERRWDLLTVRRRNRHDSSSIAGGDRPPPAKHYGAPPPTPHRLSKAVSHQPRAATMPPQQNPAALESRSKTCCSPAQGCHNARQPGAARAWCSREVELAVLDAEGERFPFLGREREHRAIRLLGVAHQVQLFGVRLVRPA